MDCLIWVSYQDLHFITEMSLLIWFFRIKMHTLFPQSVAFKIHQNPYFWCINIRTCRFKFRAEECLLRSETSRRRNHDRHWQLASSGWGKCICVGSVRRRSPEPSGSPLHFAWSTAQSWFQYQLCFRSNWSDFMTNWAIYLVFGYRMSMQRPHALSVRFRMHWLNYCYLPVPIGMKAVTVPGLSDLAIQLILFGLN